MRKVASNLPVKAVALDLDGTLFNSSNEITEPTVAALKSFVSRGGRVVIATGRPRQFAENVSAGLEDRGLAIAAVVCADGGTALKRTAPGNGTAGGGYDIICHNMASGAALSPGVLAGIRAAVPGAAFGAEVDGLGVIVSDQSYLDRVEK